MDELRSKLKDKKRVVVKIGSSSLQHPETGDLDYIKMDILVRELCNIRNQGKDVRVIHRIMEGRNYGTIFKANKNEAFNFAQFVDNLHK